MPVYVILRSDLSLDILLKPEMLRSVPCEIPVAKGLLSFQMLTIMWVKLRICSLVETYLILLWIAMDDYSLITY